MKHERSLYVFIGLLVVGLLGGLIWTFAREQTRTETERAIPTEENIIGSDRLVEVPMLRDEVTRSSDPRAQISYTVHFPRVSLVGHPDLAKEANAVISAFVSDTISQFQKNATEENAPLAGDALSSNLEMGWQALLVSPTIISLRFDLSEYIAGSAHPNSQTRVLNYDIEHHLLLGTTDLFASSTTALPLLSQYAREALKEKLTDLPDDLYASEVMPGTEPTHRNFQEVGVTTNGLLVIFNPYQVASYARGTQEITIPLEQLGDMLSHDVLTAIRLSGENIVQATEDEPANE